MVRTVLCLFNGTEYPMKDVKYIDIVCIGEVSLCAVIEDKKMFCIKNRFYNTIRAYDINTINTYITLW